MLIDLPDPALVWPADPPKHGPALRQQAVSAITQIKQPSTAKITAHTCTFC